MSQTYTANCYQSDHVAVTDMANIEANFATLRSSNSGSSAPANTEAGLQWWDTVKNLLKIRNDGDTAWLAVLQGSASQKLWIYRNDTDDGWVIDTGVTDRVIALKGGSTYVTGGAVAGSWTPAGHIHTMGTHNHQWYQDNAGANDESYNSGGSETNIISNSETGGGIRAVTASVVGPTLKLDMDCYTANVDPGDTNSGAEPATNRPAAAVGTLQYPDI